MVSIRKAFGRGFRGFFALVGLLAVMGPGAFSKLGVWLADVAASILAMVVVVYKRLKHNMGLTVSAVLGIVAVMGIVVSVPIFSHAVSSKVLREQLMEKANSTGRGMFSLHMYYIDKRSASSLTVEKAESIAGFMSSLMPQSLGLDITQMNVEVQTGAIGWFPVKTQASQPQDQAWINMSLFGQELVQKHGVLVEGQWPVPTANGPVQVAVLESAANENFINVGDQYRFNNFVIEVTAIWRAPTGPRNAIWFESPDTAYKNKLWVPMDTYRTRLYELVDRPVFFVSWYVLVDESNLRFDLAGEYAKGLVQMDADLNRLLPNIATDYSPLEALKAYQERAQTLSTLFYAVGGPMIVMALLFISLTANIAMQQYEQETVTMRGRGTSWLQVASLNLIESLALIIGALPLSLLMGWGAAFIMSKTHSFLQFTDRQDINLTFQGINILWLSLAALLILVARFLPILSLSRTSIVQLKQQRSRSTGKPLWQRFFLDFFLLLPGLYAYITLSGMAKPVGFLSALQPTPGEQYKDPLLFVAPSLFAMALCMILLRFLPLIMHLLAKITEHLPNVWAYLSLQQVSRRPQDHSAALLLIMISLSLAIYSASTAKTLDKWLIDSAYYKSGSDIAVHEYVVEGAGNTAFGPPSGGSSAVTISEVGGQEGYLSLEDHAKLPGVDAVTRVGRYEGIYSIGSGEQPATFMGIDRLDFPNVAFYRNDFAANSLGELLNRLGADQTGVLVPRRWMEETGLRMGDLLNVSINVGNRPVDRQMTIVGNYDYWPTVFPGRKPVMVMNMEAIFDDPESVIGYDVWMKLYPDADLALVDFKVRQMIGIDRAVLRYNGNAYQEVQKQINQPERVGLFGVLNVGFIATGLMPGIGFLLYSYASLRRRFIQLGILQAIGLSVRQLIGYLALEQFLLMGIAIVSGALIGLVTSVMFVPFLQISASRDAPIPPFDVLIGWTESAYLSLAFGLVLFLTMAGTIWYLVHIKVFQAVKMGEAM